MKAVYPTKRARSCIRAPTWLECRPFRSFAGTAVSKEPDRIFAQPLAQVPDFAFNEDVVRVFPDMIKRSVPGYPTIVENLGVLAAQFAQPNSVLYDLGSSLGAVTQALRRHVRTDGCRVIAVDNSAAMVERCREYLNGQDSMFQELLPVEVIEGDILALEFQPASVVELEGEDVDRKSTRLNSSHLGISY